jgi:hypothetical protein
MEMGMVLFLAVRFFFKRLGAGRTQFTNVTGAHLTLQAERCQRL